MASPLSPVFFIIKCRRESRKPTAPPRRVTGTVRPIVVSDLGTADYASALDHRCRPLHRRHARPPASSASSSSRTAAIAVHLIVDFGLVISAARRRPP
ncbi:hypothetical protein ACQJBY_010380 [Aegilops geniculata]